jgi:hypothetical protein|tara:strand:+ start:1447 stop:1638 length:192 start_codon:yes stop_codon:yes gene_type:complete
MEKNFAGMNRIIRILDEELTEQMAAGLYRESEKTRKRLEAYIDMRNTARIINDAVYEKDGSDD